MKKVMFALCFMFGGVVTLMAQDTQDTTSNQYRTETQSQYPQDGTQPSQDAQAYQQQDRERIQSTELPDEVKRTLEGADYRGWLISGAFKAKASDESMQTQGNQDVSSPESSDEQGTVNATGSEEGEIYIVELKNGAETKTLRFDKDGQKLEDMEGQHQNSQFNQDGQYNQDQNNQNPGNQYNQNEQGVQSEEADPNEEPGQTDAGATSDQAEPGNQYNQSTETRSDDAMESEESVESDETSSEIESTDDTDAADLEKTEESTESTETDRSEP